MIYSIDKFALWSTIYKYDLSYHFYAKLQNGRKYSDSNSDGVCKHGIISV